MATEEIVRPSKFDKYKEDILSVLQNPALFTGMKGVKEFLDAKYAININYQGLMTHIKGRPILRQFYEAAQAKKEESAFSESIEKAPNPERMKAIISAAARRSDFVADLVARYGEPDKAPDDAANDPLNFVWQIFLFLCRAIEVRNNPNATIMAVRQAQSMYIEGFRFLKEMKEGGTSNFHGMQLSIDASSALDPNIIAELSYALQGLNDGTSIQSASVATQVELELSPK